MCHCPDKCLIKPPFLITIQRSQRSLGRDPLVFMGFENLQERIWQREIEILIRVRYHETDQMGVVHHSNYFRYFEVARMEHLRKMGFPYKDLEDSGVYLMIMDAQCKFRAPARFDEVLAIRTRIQKFTRFRIFHHYEINRKNGEIVATGNTVLGSIAKEGVPVPLPETFWYA